MGKKNRGERKEKEREGKGEKYLGKWGKGKDEKSMTREGKGKKKVGESEKGGK